MNAESAQLHICLRLSLVENHIKHVSSLTGLVFHEECLWVHLSSELEARKYLSPSRLNDLNPSPPTHTCAVGFLDFNKQNQIHVNVYLQPLCMDLLSLYSQMDSAVLTLCLLCHKYTHTKNISPWSFS